MAAILALAGPALVVAFLVVMTVDMTRHSAWWKRRRKLCWHFHCFNRVDKCRATPAHNGPMCDEHCDAAGYHAFFCGCREPDGRPVQDKMRESRLGLLWPVIAMRQKPGSKTWVS